MTEEIKYLNATIKMIEEMKEDEDFSKKWGPLWTLDYINGFKYAITLLEQREALKDA